MVYPVPPPPLMPFSNIVVESDAVERMDEIQITGQITGQIRIRPLRTALVLGDEYAPGEFTIFCDDQNGKWNYAGFTSEDPDLVAVLRPQSTSPHHLDLHRRGEHESRVDRKKADQLPHRDGHVQVHQRQPEEKLEFEFPRRRRRPSKRDDRPPSRLCLDMALKIKSALCWCKARVRSMWIRLSAIIRV